MDSVESGLKPRIIWYCWHFLWRINHYTDEVKHFSERNQYCNSWAALISILIFMLTLAPRLEDDQAPLHGLWAQIQRTMQQHHNKHGELLEDRRLYWANLVLWKLHQLSCTLCDGCVEALVPCFVSCYIHTSQRKVQLHNLTCHRVPPVRSLVQWAVAFACEATGQEKSCSWESITQQSPPHKEPC